jgi:hypothetical protein
VYKGWLRVDEIDLEVAVKEVKLSDNPSSFYDFQHEAMIMGYSRIFIL